MKRATLVVVSLAAGLIAAACSSNPDPGRAGGNCALLPGDSAFLAGGPVYRECHVDSAARLDRRSVSPEFGAMPRPAPAGVARCIVVEVEMVVDVDGRPEDGTWRLVRSNDPAFADAIMSSVRGWRFQPAQMNGEAVRQIVRETQRAMMAIGTPGAGPPSTPRC